MKSDREIQRSVDARSSEHNVRIALKRYSEELTECDGCGAMVEEFRENVDERLLCLGCYETCKSIAIPQQEEPVSQPSVREVAPTGAELIQQERQRQIDSEGWTPDNDDHHSMGEMALAAKTYILLAQDIICGRARDVYPGWPWDYSWWKPSPDPIRNLVKAGALIAAEIDRLQRKEDSNVGPK